MAKTCKSMGLAQLNIGVSRGVPAKFAFAGAVVRGQRKATKGNADGLQRSHQHTERLDPNEQGRRSRLRTCAEGIKNPQLRTMFNQAAERRAAGAAEHQNALAKDLPSDVRCWSSANTKA
jgi:hypothetical protein